MNNKRQLLNEWIQAYKERLKPHCSRGDFRCLTTNALSKWKELQFNYGKTYWGGEPAGDLLTNYLQPQEWILYTTETRNEMITYCPFVPDDAGNVKVYHQFYAPPSEEGITVPPILAYADLILQGTQEIKKRHRKFTISIYKISLGQLRINPDATFLPEAPNNGHSTIFG